MSETQAPYAGLPVRFFVPGRPVAKQSFRFARTGGYTAANVKDWQTLVMTHARQHFTSLTPVVSFVRVDMEFYLPDRRRVDLDNLSKAVLDGLKGVIFADDSQVVTLHLEKFYGSQNPGVDVVVNYDN